MLKSNPDGFMVLLISIGAIIIAFFICRELLCWYWKINERKKVQEDILNEIKKTNNMIEQFTKKKEEVSIPQHKDIIDNSVQEQWDELADK